MMYDVGRRINFHQSPELHDCSIEISAPAEYCSRPPMPPTFVFLIDVSINAVVCVCVCMCVCVCVYVCV